MSMPQSEAPRRSSHSVSSRSTAPRVFRYVLNMTTGFAPCFDDGVCTLGCCKPNIRRSAVVGDWILGFAPRKKGNARLLFVMQVGEVLGFDESNRFAAGVHEAEARRQRGDKDSPSGKASTPPAESGAQWVMRCSSPRPPRSQANRRRRPWASLTEPAANSVWASRDHATLASPAGVGVASWPLPSHALKRHPIENIDRRDVVITDGQPFAIRTESDAARETSAWRADWDADAAKVWVLVR